MQCLDLDSNTANYELEDNLHIFHCQKILQAAPTKTVQEPNEAHTYIYNKDHFVEGKLYQQLYACTLCTTCKP